jgi:hypothetical protein
MEYFVYLLDVGMERVGIEEEEKEEEEEGNHLRKEPLPYCHTRFPEGNQMHLICVPGSSSTHMIDEMSVIS